MVALGYVQAKVASDQADPAAVLEALRPWLDAPQLQPSGATLALPGIEAQRSKDAEQRAVVLRVFNHWRMRTGRERAKLTPERDRAIRARLRDGYTERDLLAAIEGVASSPFHCGANDNGVRYDELTLVLRNGSNVERFAQMGGGAASTVSIGVGGREVEEVEAQIKNARQELADAAAKKDRAAYERANERLRKLMVEREKASELR